MNTPYNRDADRPLRTSDLASAGTPPKDRAEEETRMDRTETTRMDRTQENRIERATEDDESRARRDARETNRAEREASAEERKATAAKRVTESEGMHSPDDTALAHPDDEPVLTRSAGDPENRRPQPDALPTEDREQLDPLFSTDVAADYRARWTAVQSSFVDDPREAVQKGDELVAQVMSGLAKSFAEEREKLEGQLGETGDASTENLRVVFRRYRSFFERLLAL